MSDTVEYENAIKDIANYAARHVASTYEVTFPEGDCYRCRFSNSEYDDNGEELDSPEYEEWYVVDFKVAEIMEEGPNKDPRYEYITISRKRMPSLVKCDDEVVYQTE